MRITAHTTASTLSDPQIRATSVSLSEMRPGNVRLYLEHTGIYVVSGQANHFMISGSNPSRGGAE